MRHLIKLCSNRCLYHKNVYIMNIYRVTPNKLKFQKLPIFVASLALERCQQADLCVFRATLVYNGASWAKQNYIEKPWHKNMWFSPQYIRRALIGLRPFLTETPRIETTKATQLSRRVLYQLLSCAVLLLLFTRVHKLDFDLFLATHSAFTYFWLPAFCS